MCIDQHSIQSASITEVVFVVCFFLFFFQRTELEFEFSVFFVPIH